MNLDFHYYATYYAACEAGYGKEDAEKIATAAQMVDECTPNLKKQKEYQDIDKDKYVVTSEEIEDNVSDDIAFLSVEKSPTLQKVRRIWVPFHFLPGNLSSDAILDYTGKTTWGGLLSYKDDTNDKSGRDKRDFQCICLPNSYLAEDMIRDTKERGDKSEEDKLNLIGIRMHVLADTWAHQCFAGSPNYWINEVADIKNELDDSKISGETSPIGISNYEISYLGHGRIGHLPDLGYAKYSYQPKWSSRRLFVDNEVRFLMAYYQMVSAMKYILKGEAFDIKKVDIGQNEEKLRNAIGFNNKDIQCICENWIGIKIKDSNGAPISPPNKFEILNSDKLPAFSEMAALHREYVMEKVNACFPADEPYFV